MSRTLWLLVVLAVVERGIADNRIFPEGHGLIDGSYVKIREEIVKDFRLLAGGFDPGDEPSVLSQSLSALPALTSFPVPQPLASSGGFPAMKAFPGLVGAVDEKASTIGLNKKDDCTDCSDSTKN